MQKARSQETSHPKARAPSYRLSACGFRLSFTPRTGVLFTCPSRYSFTIGHTGVFSLGGWSPQLHASLLGSKALLRNSTTHMAWLSPTGLSPSRAPRSRGLQLASTCASVGPTTPVPQGDRFGLGPVRSPLLGPSRLISLPPGTEMFQFPGFASLRRVMTVSKDGRVAPFGHPGLIACVRLPLAYRSLPRPSSPPCAQASPTYLRSLDYLSRPSRARAIYTSDAFRRGIGFRRPTASIAITG